MANAIRGAFAQLPLYQELSTSREKAGRGSLSASRQGKLASVGGFDHLAVNQHTEQDGDDQEGKIAQRVGAYGDAGQIDQIQGEGVGGRKYGGGGNGQGRERFLHFFSSRFFFDGLCGWGVKQKAVPPYEFRIIARPNRSPDTRPASRPPALDANLSAAEY